MSVDQYRTNVGDLAHYVFQSQSQQQLSKSHIAIHHSQAQVTVNQKGKKERVFVDLRAVYPSPDEPGTELSFEEIWAATRGWLHQSWDTEEQVPSEVDRLARKMSHKLVVHHDVVQLDENGAPLLPKTGKPRKKKVSEVNHTQISEYSTASTGWLKVAWRKTDTL